MSMSVEQVMYNYQKKIEQLKININFVRENLTILLQQLKAIDASGLNCQQTKKYLKELDAIIADIENNELVKSFSQQEHVELEQAKQINFYLEQKKLRLAEIQQEVELLKIKVIEDETKQRVVNLKNRLNLNHDQLEQELLGMFDDKQSQAIILSFFKENKNKLVNFSPTKITEILKEEINNYRTTTEFVKNQYLNSFKEQVSRDKFVQAELVSDLEQFSKLDLETFQELNKKALALQNKIITKQLDESARKHAISSILQSIQKRGFIVNNNDIRLVKENEDSVVIVYAKKITGEEAIFKVYLDGRFTYKFEGYEGHAHDTDEQPFINDLSMYDVSLSKEQKKTYLNPDRLMNKAKINVNNNTNKNKK